MNILSMAVQYAPSELYFMLSIILLMAFRLLINRKQHDGRHEGVIDLYCFTSRRLYCTSETCRILTGEEAKDVELLIKQHRMIRGRFVETSEGKTADIFNSGRQTKIYGYSYHPTC